MIPVWPTEPGMGGDTDTKTHAICNEDMLFMHACNEDQLARRHSLLTQAIDYLEKNMKAPVSTYVKYDTDAF